jgi:uncharacterized membrane protein YbhN (UPF0104 family)
VSYKKYLQRFLPVVLALVIIALAGRVLLNTFSYLSPADVIARLRAIAAWQVVLGAVLVATLYLTLANYEAAVSREVSSPVSPRRAMLGAVLASSIGHVIGWGVVSGGAIRYRLYSAVLMRPLEIGKMALLIAMPYPLALGLLLGLSLVLQSVPAGLILHVTPETARGTGLSLLALHLIYVTLIQLRRQPIMIGRFVLVLPRPPFTTLQYVVGIIEVSCGAGLLYVLLPHELAPPFLVLLGVYVLSILAGIASSVPAGIGVFEAVIVTLLPAIPKDTLIATILAYRLLLELIPVAVAIVVFVAYEVWWRLPTQRRRLAALELAAQEDERIFKP